MRCRAAAQKLAVPESGTSSTAAACDDVTMRLVLFSLLHFIFDVPRLHAPLTVCVRVFVSVCVCRVSVCLYAVRACVCVCAYLFFYFLEGNLQDFPCERGGVIWHKTIFGTNCISIIYKLLHFLCAI